jgi:septum formation topological specificity factor MinE
MYVFNHAVSVIENEIIEIVQKWCQITERDLISFS